jgi:hypothetical protein
MLSRGAGGVDVRFRRVGATGHDGPAARESQISAHAYAPQPACSPPTRSATIFSAHPDRR